MIALKVLVYRGDQNGEDCYDWPLRAVRLPGGLSLRGERGVRRDRKTGDVIQLRKSWNGLFEL